MKQKITIDITGETISDLDVAIEEAVHKIYQGFTSGDGDNKTGSYSFNVATIEEEEVEPEDGEIVGVSQKYFLKWNADTGQKELSDVKTDVKGWTGLTAQEQNNLFGK